MNTITLIGLAVVLVLILLMSILKSINIASVVKAGNIEDFQFRYFPDIKQKPSQIECDGEIIPTDQLEYMLVKGNSMQWYGIRSGNHVLISLFKDAEKRQIKDKPVLLFSVDENDGEKVLGREYWESHYKLRKFITYLSIKDIDFGQLYDKYKGEISIPKEAFIKRCNMRLPELNKDECYILSETYDCKEKENRYSLHSITHLLGRVEYVAA